MNRTDRFPPTDLTPSATGAHAAVARSIGRRIVAGTFPSGTILPNESAWSAEFGVSRSVVREAVKYLAAKGLLTSRPRIGTRVEPKERWNMLDQDVLAWWAETPRQTEFLKSLQQFRRIFEPEAAALAASLRTEAQLDDITGACRAMAEAPTMGDRSRADVAFHLAILKASGNELLLPLGILIEETLRSMFERINMAAGSLRHAQELHNGIVDAIRARNADGARAAVHALLDNSDKMIGQFDRQAPDEAATVDAVQP